MAQAPRLAGVLSSQPEIIDALIDPDFETPLQDADGGLGRHSTDEQDLEEAMNAVRRRVREQHFQYGAGVLRGALSHDKASSLITRLADESVQTLLQAAIKDVERRLERPGGQAAVLAMGKMGGHEMTIGSDLDIMVIYDSRGHDQQAAHVFYTKVTQRLISALSAPTQEGGLYEVDMALRPSGSAGPITVSFAAFERYYASEAWVWEFMALTRGRVCASTDEAFQNRLTASVEAILPCAGSTAKIKADVLNMRLRLERDKPPRGLWDVKRCRGGLVDIEFIVQYLQLVHAKTTLAVLGQNTYSALENLRDNDGLEARLANPLMSAHALYSKMRHYLAVSIGGKFLPDDHPNIISDNLSTYCGFDTFSELTRVYENTKDESLAIFKALLG